MYRLALIGCLDFAAYARIVPRLGARIVAVADRDRRLARLAAEALDATIVTDGLEPLMATHAGAFDALIVQSRVGGRLALCDLAVRGSKHLLVEEPLAPDVRSANEILTRCTRAGVRLMVGQPYRFLPSVQVVKSALASGKLGDPGLVRIHRWNPADPATQATPSGSDASREIDLACWLVGQHPNVVRAVARPDYVQVHFGFPAGGMALLDRARTLPPGQGYFSLSVIASTGAAYADDHHDTQLLFGRGRPAGLLTGQGDLALLGQVQEFLRSIEQHREPVSSGAEGLRTLEVAEAVSLSLRTGQAIHRVGNEYRTSEARS